MSISGAGGGQLEQAPCERLRVAHERRKRRRERQALPVSIVEHEDVACGGVHGDALDSRTAVGAGAEKSRQCSAADLAVHDISKEVAHIRCNNEEFVRGV